ncbi:NFX1-type zinc finger-containing protein 1 [Bulinus truncatus]|nr:NFX1-type zinc finger-containing protein 1 [Bulinus truncatus]
MSAAKQTRGLTINELISKWDAAKSAGDLVSSMVQHQADLTQIFLTKGEIGEQFFPALVRCFILASQVRKKREEFGAVLKILCESSFLTHHLTVYTSSVRDVINWQDVIDILTIILSQLPQFSFKVMVAASQLNLVINKMDAQPGRDRLLNSLACILNEAKPRQQNGGIAAGRHNSLFQYKDKDTPPDNFMDLSVVPTSCELLDQSPPYLRRAVVKGPYKDVEHYLDIHFRLMKLDFLIPLKNGLKQLSGKKNLTGFRCSEIRLYHNVRVVNMSFKKGFNHVLQFDISKFKNFDWEKSDRLMEGSLVCLSKDCFKTIIVATVVKRDVKGLEDGIIEINVKDGLDILLQCTDRDPFVMAESDTFYNPYSHVLKGLKIMVGKFPFQNVLVRCDPELKPPAYILSNGKGFEEPNYDLSCLMREQKKTLVPVLTTVKWPAAGDMHLNESQRDAAILALTKEVCVIQGPPGTGKTYVGLKVVETLLKNRSDAIKGRDDSTRDPILIVCYTNHALDQFLEGITKFCPSDIVRVGGGCKTESLKQFNLNTLQRKKYIPVSSDKIHIEEKIKNLHHKIRLLKAKVQSDEFLQRFMVQSHYESLNETPSRQLSSWLNAPSGATQNDVPKEIQRILKKLALHWKYPWSGDIQLFKEMNIIDRCAIYRKIIQKVRERINAKLHFARRDNKVKSEEEMKLLLNRSYSDILPDAIFDEYLSRSFTSKIRKTLYPKKQDVKDIIEYWLLGQHRSSRCQLQDIEVLSRHLKETISAIASGISDVEFSNDNGDMEQEDPEFKSTVSSDSEKEDLLYLIRQVEELRLDELEESFNRPSSVSTTSEGGWINARNTAVFSLSKVISKVLSAKPMTDEEEKSVKDIWKLNIKQRYSLYMLWLKRYEDHLKEKLNMALEELKSLLRLEKDEIDEETASLLKRSRIIGMTTTGAAKHKSLLDKVGCSVVIVEEAAEVLEAHVITALNVNCQHLILIGDHQQLRPKPATYALERNFGLDVSLFERLILNKIPHVTLKIQHRMRPEVSQIIKLIYPGLEDHPSVCEFEHIRGVSKDVFFINHNHQETRSADNFSKSNMHEAQYAVALCKYLLKQDYLPTQVTILATYKGQVTLIKKYLAREYLRIRVSAVDDFQGEENEIIILSLVRSNEENIAGFVKIDNRVCVALSRAKKGFFVLGNFDFLASKSKLWRNIIDTAKKNDMIGPGLPVQCHSHPQSVKYLSTAVELESRSEEGCGSPCTFLLKCGHRCQLRCHGYDLGHEKNVCKQPCMKSCKDGHPCSLKCNDVCRCKALVTRTFTKCGHQGQIACCVSPETATCPEKCSNILSCGHLCQGMCNDCVQDGDHELCTENVQYTFQPCGHEGEVPCYKSKTQVLCEVMRTEKLNCGHLQQIPCHLSPENAKCSEKCPSTLPCGHLCTGQCGECNATKQHKVCRVNVDYTYKPCGHTGQEPCSLTKEEPLCPKECSVKLPCGHSCPGICSDCVGNNKHKDCRLIVDYTFQLCGHIAKVPCYKTSTHIQCTVPCTPTLTKEEAICPKKCSVKLSCGHTCSGKCSECAENQKHEDCLVEVDHIHQSCGHTSKVPCYKTSTHIQCTVPCTSTLRCGHQCKGTCSDCLRGLVHQACDEYCHLPLPCGHPCQGYCSTPCLPCQLPCPFKCRHRSCTNKHVQKSCGEPCTPCRIECMQKCKHLVNLKYCSENWDNDPCSEMCTKKLKSYVPGRNGQGRKLCLHPCKSICGEICVCSQCEKVNSIEKEASIDKPQGPILKLPLCKHTFYVSELDNYVKGQNQSESSFIVCPLCKKPLLNCLRYDDINQQRFELREQRKRELIRKNHIDSELEDRLERSRNILRLLEDYKHFEEDDDSSMKFSNQCEFLSESIKLKFVYAVAKLNVDLKEGQQLDLINILRKTTRLAQQTEMEMNQEITRRLSLNALNFLEKQCSAQVLEHFLPKMNEIKEDLNKAPTSPEVLERAHEMISLVYDEEIKSAQQLAPELTNFKDTHMKIVQVLQSRTDETLVDVLYPDMAPTNKILKSVPMTSPQHRDMRSTSSRGPGPSKPSPAVTWGDFIHKASNQHVKKEETQKRFVKTQSVPRSRASWKTTDAVRGPKKVDTFPRHLAGFRTASNNHNPESSIKAPAKNVHEKRQDPDLEIHHPAQPSNASGDT